MAYDMTGEVVDGYRLEERLSHSGQADVYKAYPAERDRIARPVAIKIVHNEERDPVYIQRFMREMRLMDELRHPNIIPMVAWGITEKQHPYLITQFMDDLRSLEVELQEHPFTPYMVWEILKPVTDALQHIHDVGVLHRDIKPSKIFLHDSPEGRVAFLGSFGLSKQMGVDATVTASNTYVGTPAYMPPEVAHGNEPSQLSDLYSLAVTTYEMLMGMPPFDPNWPPMRLTFAHAELIPPSLVEHNPAFPQGLDDVVMRGLMKVPDSRYASVQDLAKAYKNALDKLSPEEQNQSYQV